MKMTQSEARDIRIMERAGKPLFSNVKKASGVEPERFASMVERGLWRRDGDGYRPTDAAIDAAWALAEPVRCLMCNRLMSTEGEE